MALDSLLILGLGKRQVQSAKAWAEGSEDPSSEQYQNSAKYYSEQSEAFKEDAESAKLAAEAARDLLETSVLQVSENTKRIDTAEKTISELNPNGESRVAVSGYGALSLPKNAAQGGLTGNVNGMTLTPLAFGDDVAVSGTLAFNSVLNNKYYDSLHKTILTGTGSEMTVANDTAAVADIAVYDLNAFGLQAVTAANCALMIPATMSGTKSSLVTRGRSVGKNLLDRNSSFGNFYVENTYVVTAHASYNAYRVKVKPETAYRMTKVDGTNLGASGGIVRYEDINKTLISGSQAGYNAPSATYTTPANCYYMVFSIGKTVTSDYQLEPGSTATTYEAFKSSAAYLEPLPLNRLPNGTVDSYNLQTRAHTQRIKRYVLTADDITLDTTTLTNVDVIRIAWARLSGILVATTTDYVATSVMTSISTPLNNAIAVPNTAEYAWRHYLSSGAGVSIITPKGQYATEAAAKTALTGTVIYYQLAEASYIVTNNAVTGNLIGYPSGTIYYEKALADAGMYSSGISILRTGYPITSLESIQKVNADGTLTSLATSGATVAANGLSFTHTGLTDGDIVFFTYSHTAESVNGSNTVNYLDSNFVIADTADGKFYKWKPVITNGAIASWAITEVV